MIGRLGSLLMSFRGRFAREATFRWFVVAVLGFIVRLDHHGVSSSIRWLQIRPELYEPFLAFFRSPAWKLDAILPHWQSLVAQRCAVRTRGGAFVWIGDGIKVAKEAERMPGVKKLHQESENSGKAPWIFGHHFGVVGMLVGSEDKCFCAPLAAELHEGVQPLRELQGKTSPVVDAVEKTTIGSLMGQLVKVVCLHLAEPCVAVLDAYFAVGSTFKIAQTARRDDGQRLLHIVTRAKSNVVAYEDPPTRYSGRGRPRKQGRKVALHTLFTTHGDAFETVTVVAYNEAKTVSVLGLDLLWNPIREKLRFVLVKDQTRTFILMCSDRTMEPVEIVELYASRFKIEVVFKTLKHLMGGFAYHFWTTAWHDAAGCTGAMAQLNQLPDQAQRLITEATNAIEAFVNIALIATGMLQLLAIDCTAEIRKHHRWWLRTYSSQVPSEEMVKTVIQHEFYHHFRNFKHTAIYRIIRDKARKQAPDPMRQAA
jgi:hypothetical protein